MMKKILSGLSFRSEQIAYICEKSTKGLDEALKSRNRELNLRKTELKEIEAKLEKLEERMVNDEIESVTYKKWFGKFSTQKSLLQFQICHLSGGVNDKWERLKSMLEYTTDLEQLYDNFSLRCKHKLLNGVFKAGLIFNGRCFRTL